MFGYLLRRVFAVVPVMAFVAIFIFVLLRITPGDPAEILAGDSATAEQIAAVREAIGLNEPIYIQFLTWVGQMLSGDMGTSLISRTPVTDMIIDRFAPTLSIAVLTMMLTVLIAVPMGVMAAWWHRRWVDYLIMAISVIGFSIPVFVIAYMLILTFSIRLGWFPVQGFSPISEGVGPFLYRAFLPVLTLTAIYVALIARMTRANMLEVLGEDYIRTARAKGAPERRVLFHHALRNAAVPILTVIGSGFAFLISGVVVTESIFNIPGLGRLTVDAVLARDYPVIQAMILVVSAIYVLINLLIDLAYVLFDPRIRY